MSAEPGTPASLVRRASPGVAAGWAASSRGPFSTNGTLVVLVTCNSKTFLSESNDEGATWSITNQIPHGGTLRIDSANNMYLLEKATDSKTSQGELLLSHSTDGGLNWSPELNMVAPGVVSVGTWNFAQGTFAQGLVGDVGVTYYGNRKGNTTSDGFITATRDALDNNPVFWSGQVNSTTGLCSTTRRPTATSASPSWTSTAAPGAETASRCGDHGSRTVAPTSSPTPTARAAIPAPTRPTQRMDSPAASSGLHKTWPGP